mgnify:CR=1 FL=1
MSDDKENIELSCQKNIYGKIDKLEIKVEEVKDDLVDLKLEIIPRLDRYNDQLEIHIASSKANSERLRHIEEWVIKREAIEEDKSRELKRGLTKIQKFGIIVSIVTGILTLLAKFNGWF